MNTNELSHKEQITQQALLSAILKADIKKSQSIIADSLDSSGWYGTCNGLIEPVIMEFGQHLDNGADLSLAQGYVASKTIELIVRDNIISDDDPESGTRTVLIGNAEDDMHELGKMMVTSFLRKDGWNVIDLGIDVSPEIFVDEAVSRDARVIGVSAMTYTNAMNIVNVRNEIDRRGLKGKIKLAVGGAVFVARPELVDQVGGDGTVSSALKASVLMNRLWEEAESAVEDSAKRDHTADTAAAMEAIISSLPTERRAAILNLSLYGSRLTGYSTQEHYHNPEAFAEGVDACKARFQMDLLTSPFAFTIEGEAFGATIAYKERQAPILSQPALADPGQLDRLAVPDVDSHPRLTYIRETLRLLTQRHGETSLIASSVMCPMTLPPLLVGLEKWLEIVLADPDTMSRILDITLPHFVRWGNSLLEDGANFLIVPMLFANSSIIPREFAEERIFPIIEEAFSQVKGPVFIHHGAFPVQDFIDFLAGVSNVSGFVVDPYDAKETVLSAVKPGQVVVTGIDGPTLCWSSPEEIRQKTQQVLDQWQDYPLFAFGTTAADISYDTPAENIDAILETIEEHSNAQCQLV